MGPLLWNITYDSVLKMPTPDNCEVICYADDTLIIVGGRSMREVAERAEIVGNAIAKKIKWMGLQVAAEKTEAIRFRRAGERRKKQSETIMIENTRIEIGSNIRYLGITVADDWSIKEHMSKTVNKVEIIVNKLGRIMTNKKGPSEKKRKLYQNVINSILLYGAPVWAEEANKHPKVTGKARAVQRKVAIRVIRAYRTISLDVALLLARNPPIELQAGKLSEVYRKKKLAEEENNCRLTKKGLDRIREQENEKMVKRWLGKLMDKADAGRGMNWEILSCFREWIGRNHGELTFQMTQIITGHGCFKGYPHRIGKTEESGCSFCGREVEDNVHVLAECTKWREEREGLERSFGGRVRSLGALLRGMAADPGKWRATTVFARAVMDRKERMEREEQARARARREAEEAPGESSGRARRGRTVGSCKQSSQRRTR